MSERTEIALMSRQSWEALDCSGDDEVDQSDGETRVSVPAAVQDHQIQARSKRKAQTGKKLFRLGWRDGLKVYGRGSEGKEEAGDCKAVRWRKKGTVRR